MKKNIWFRYGTGGETIEIIVRDPSGAKLESWRADVQDKKKIRNIYTIIKRKYNINLFVINKKEDKDLNWLN